MLISVCFKSGLVGEGMREEGGDVQEGNVGHDLQGEELFWPRHNAWKGEWVVKRFFVSCFEDRQDGKKRLTSEMQNKKGTAARSAKRAYDPSSRHSPRRTLIPLPMKTFERTKACRTASKANYKRRIHVRTRSHAVLGMDSQIERAVPRPV
jgi:hypothetical protein